MISTSVAYDGHTRILGVDTSSDPAETSPRYLSGAINRSFRSGRNQTRPGYSCLKHEFADEETKNIFQKGAVTCCFGYKKWRTFSTPALVVAVHDRIVVGEVAGNKIRFKTLIKGLQTGYMQSWMIQVHDRLYFQNGIQNPIGWDGVGEAYFIPSTSADGMPIGTAMAYNQGRLVVFTTDNYAIVSDYIYGNGVRDTKGVEKFTEWKFNTDLGAIGTPADLGSIVGGISIPRPGTINGQAELLVMCEQGAYTLDLTGERSTWFTKGIQTPVLQGRGGASAYSLVAANSDVWFSTADAEISSYKYERSEREKVWGDTALSREVGLYLGFTDPSRMKYVSSVRAANRLLTTCCITTKPGSLGGTHRYGQGIVALDFDKGSTVNAKAGFSWDGLWTGLNTVQLVNLYVNGNTRCLSVSHDEDGINRVYEITKKDNNDFREDGSESMIQSAYETPFMFETVEPQEAPILRSFRGCNLHASGVRREAFFSFRYRSNYRQKWHDLHGPVRLGVTQEATDAAKQNVLPNYGLLEGMIQTPEPRESDCEANYELTRVANSFQVEVSIKGVATVNRFQAEASLHEEPQVTSCNETDGVLLYGQYPQLTERDFFGYKIQPS